MAKGTKSGGRCSGTPNKITRDLKETINDFLNNNIESLQDNFNQLDAKDKINFIERLLRYSIPRMADIPTIKVQWCRPTHNNNKMTKGN